MKRYVYYSAETDELFTLRVKPPIGQIGDLFDLEYTWQNSPAFLFTNVMWLGEL